MLQLDNETHIYRWDNKVVPSTTQVFSRVAVRNNEEAPWRSVSGSEFMGNYETAARYGTEFHKAAAYIVQGINCKYDPVLEPDIISLKLFLREYKIILKLVEKPLYSKLYGFAGTLDLYGELDTPPIIVDWKTATTFQEYWRSQTAGYEKLIAEELKIKKRFHRWTVRFKQDGKMPDIDKRYNHPQDWNRFLSLLNVYKTYSKESHNGK